MQVIIINTVSYEVTFTIRPENIYNGKQEVSLDMKGANEGDTGKAIITAIIMITIKKIRAVIKTTTMGFYISENTVECSSIQ